MARILEYWASWTATMTPSGSIAEGLQSSRTGHSDLRKEDSFELRAFKADQKLEVSYE